MSLPKPYYDDGKGIVIYCGDCREILPLLDPVDLVLTDPPYGIADIWSSGSEKHGWGKANRESVIRNEWDREPPTKEMLDAIRGKGRDAIFWGGNYFDLPPSRCWFIWNKPERGFSLAEAEMAWVSKDAVIRVCDCNRSEVDRNHPTQKPLKLMTWCLSFFPKAQTILDPFMGSGTTLVAAKNLGRKCIGIELEEKYCEIAVNRLAQDVLDFSEVQK